MNDEMLIALTRIERAVQSYCCRDDSDVDGILTDIERFAREGIAAAGTELIRHGHQRLEGK